MGILVLSRQTCLVGSTKSAQLHLDNEGLNRFDIWTFTNWCQQAGRLNVIRTTKLDANFVSKVKATLASVFTPQLAFATARV